MCRKSVKPIQRGVNLLIGVNELGTQSRVRSLYNLWFDVPSTPTIPSSSFVVDVDGCCVTVT